MNHPPLLPSRDAADEALRSALDGDSGLFVLTGEAGGGKTRLWRGVAAERTYPFLWIEIDSAPGDTPTALHRRISLALGIEAGDRESWLAFLDDRRRDGERCVLVIEEAHNLTPELLEEVRALSGIEAVGLILLVGQTPLARRLSAPAHRAFVSRVVGAAHLPPIDADEAQILLEDAFPSHRFTSDEVERLHRDCWGEPRRLLKLARSRFTHPGRSAVEPQTEAPARPAPNPKKPAPTAAPPEPRLSRAVPLLGESRPPLRVEDGLIEVGWSSEYDAAGDEPEPTAAPVPPRSEALDAWAEWAKSQGRGPMETARTESPAAIHDVTDIRIEPAQEFVRYGPHFGRKPSIEERDA